MGGRTPSGHVCPDNDLLRLADPFAQMGQNARLQAMISTGDATVARGERGDGRAASDDDKRGSSRGGEPRAGRIGEPARAAAQARRARPGALARADRRHPRRRAPGGRAPPRPEAGGPEGRARPSQICARPNVRAHGVCRSARSRMFALTASADLHAPKTPCPRRSWPCARAEGVVREPRRASHVELVDRCGGEGGVELLGCGEPGL